MPIEISIANESNKIWAAKLMSGTPPWTILGTDYDKCLSTCTDPVNHVYISKLGGENCGVIIMQDKGVAGSPYIKSLAVDSRFRNHGIGKDLLKFAEDQYRSTSKHLFLCVSSFNEGAQKFYMESGFSQVGEFEDYIVAGYSELLLYKRLR
jgi:ribosomal protein S18 acetylase RimI-like enzyme